MKRTAQESFDAEAFVLWTITSTCPPGASRELSRTGSRTPGREARVTPNPPSSPDPQRPLRRSRRHRLIAGVCGGLAEWREWNPTLVRLLFVLVGALPVFPGIVAYLVLWLLVPLEEQVA